MAVGSVSSLGVGSGMDLQNILDSLKKADSAVINIKTQQKTDLESRLEVYDSIKNQLFTLKSHALNLSLSSNYIDRSVNVSSSSVMSATVLTGTSVGSQSVDVSRLAQKNTYQSTGLESQSTSVTAIDTTFSYTLGDDQDAISLSVKANTTLQGLADLINSDTNNPGVTATVIDTGVGDNRYHLALSSDATGESSRIRMVGQISGFNLTEMLGSGYEAVSDNTVRPITIDDTNKFVDFQINGGGELNATIATGTYTPDELAAAVESAMETASPGASINVSYNNSTGKYTTKATGVTSLEMLWGTGTNTANSAAATLGFDATDDTGLTSYTSDNQVNLITIDATNDQIVFKEKTPDGALSGNLTASIAQADYTDMDTLATAIETAMESASENNIDYDVMFDHASNKFVVSEAGTLEQAQLLWTSSNAAATLGFASDDILTPQASSLNAELTANGITFQRESNSSISDIISGVTMNLVGTGTTNLTVDATTDTIKDDITGFVSALNDLVQDLKEKRKYDIETGEKGPLANNSSVTTLGNDLISLFTSTVNTGGTIKSLYDLGFEIDREGILSIKESVLSSKLSSSLDDIATFFTGDFAIKGKRFEALSDTTVRPITISDANKYIDFAIDGGGELTATLTTGTYTPDQMASAMETALEAASPTTDFTVSYSTSNAKFTIQAAGVTTLDLLWSTGSNTANSAHTTLGYTAADDTGALSYDSDNQVNLFTLDATNNKIVFKEKLPEGSLSGSLTATIATGNYTSGDSLAAAIEAAFEAASTNSLDYTVSFDESSNKFNIVQTGDTEQMQIVWSSSSAASILGYTTDDISDPVSSTQLFTGLADTLNNRLRDLTSQTGLVESEKMTTQTSIDRLEEIIKSSTERLTQRYDALTLEFVKLDTYMSRMKSQQDALSSMFNSLTSSKS